MENVEELIGRFEKTIDTSKKLAEDTRTFVNAIKARVVAQRCLQALDDKFKENDEEFVDEAKLNEEEMEALKKDNDSLEEKIEELQAELELFAEDLFAVLDSTPDAFLRAKLEAWAWQLKLHHGFIRPSHEIASLFIIPNGARPC